MQVAPSELSKAVVFVTGDCKHTSVGWLVAFIDGTGRYSSITSLEPTVVTVVTARLAALKQRLPERREEGGSVILRGTVTNRTKYC